MRSLSPAGCTFEEDSDPSLCEYRQAQEDDFDWQLVRTYSWPHMTSDLIRESVRATRGVLLKCLWQRPSNNKCALSIASGRVLLFRSLKLDMLWTRNRSVSGLEFCELDFKQTGGAMIFPLPPAAGTCQPCSKTLTCRL
ncbi:Receptor-type tyrosine-protein phosphatase U [Labeo rohita]|uniref:Receptor-type tyrosine-protein phosphatase U n=1 Tax=Labeo rohita TaxID=84645 RepID=A0ABQ8LQ06_LABRO|nr:Receptor-type tyrosine-protein phosphatase U [Labeo rohita]